MTGEQITPWVGLGLSALVIVERLWARMNDHTAQQLNELHQRIGNMQSTLDRAEGAQLVTRVTTLEAHQRTDQTLLARIDQRLVSADSALVSIHSILERM